jgi:hypothetical protein
MFYIIDLFLSMLSGDNIVWGTGENVSGDNVVWGV